MQKVRMRRSLKEVLPRKLTSEDVVFVCIGTDRSTGDALGPIVGTGLADKGYHVFGTLDDPVHAMNLEEVVLKLPKDKLIIGVDACLGATSSVGAVEAGFGPILPGAGVYKKLPPVGKLHIKGIVNVGGFMEYFVLQNTRLSLVMEMAAAIVDDVTKSIPIKKEARRERAFKIGDFIQILSRKPAREEVAT